MRLFLIIIFLRVFICTAQDKYSELTENFAYSVKTIDEFIDRFDFRRGTEFEKFLLTNHPEIKYSRMEFLFSLFNFRNESFSGNPDIMNFINSVSDTANPVYINFSDSSWFALVECSVKYKSKPETLSLVMKVDVENNTFRWSIVSAFSRFLGNVSKDDSLFDKTNNYLKNRNKDKSRYFLHPVSHAIGFMNIDALFSSGNKSFEEYIHDGPRTIQLQNLVEKVKKSEIKFVHVNTISYHFMQIEGWIAIVDYFNRNEKNSGWLINSLIKAGSDEKRIYKEKKLKLVQYIK